MEIWKDIQGYEGLYKVSSLGRIQSNHSNKKGEGWQFLDGSVDLKGYRRVSLYKNNNEISKKIHRLVLEVFLPNPENKKEVNHINGNKLDKRLENLEWATLQENMAHAFKNKLIPVMGGERNGQAKIKETDVIKIRSLYDSGTHYKQIAKMFNLSNCHIHKIVTKKLWKNVK